MAGNYVLMMFYTTVAGWLLLYVFKMAKGDFVGLDADGVAGGIWLCTGKSGTDDGIYAALCRILFFHLCDGTPERR